MNTNLLDNLSTNDLVIIAECLLDTSKAYEYANQSETAVLAYIAMDKDAVDYLVGTGKL